MAVLNSFLRSLIDTLLAPLSGSPPLVGIALWSIPTAIFALLVFKRTSNQERIAEVKRRIHACLFEIRLFNDDLRAIVRAQGEILRHVLHYQGLALKPMVWILPPLLLIMVQLHAFYGFRGLRPGDTALVTLELADDWSSSPGDRPEVRLDTPPGLELDSPGIWVPSLEVFNWRIAAEEPGNYELRIAVGDAEVAKNVRVTDRVVRLSPVRPARTILGQLEWPSEPPIEKSLPIREISVAYPEASVNIFGWHMTSQYAWMVVFFVLTMVIAIALKGKMGVEL